MSAALTPRLVRDLKAKAQHLEPVVRVGRGGLSPLVVAAVLQALRNRDLIKVRFEQDRPERGPLAQQLADQTQSHLIMQVGKVAVYYRPQPDAGNQAGPTGQAGPVLPA